TGALILGAINGLVIGLLAVGLVLIYKSNRFLNLAHAQLGVVSALVLSKLVLQWHWNWWAAFVVCVALGGLVGVVVHRAVSAPLRAKTKSTMVVLLASIGVTQLLLALNYVPALRPADVLINRNGGYPLPFTSHIQ